MEQVSGEELEKQNAEFIKRLQEQRAKRESNKQREG